MGGIMVFDALGSTMDMKPARGPERDEASLPDA